MLLLTDAAETTGITESAEALVAAKRLVMDRCELLALLRQLGERVVGLVEPSLRQPARSLRKRIGRQVAPGLS